MFKRTFPHVLLFVLTVLSTIWVGGRLYSLAIMTILLSHEMGHYLTSRRYGVPSSLPYFIPFPYFPFGTFGAVIKMRGVIFDKRSLFDIGASGPLAGFILSFVCACIGIKLSVAVKMSGAASAGLIELGDPCSSRPWSGSSWGTSRRISSWCCIPSRTLRGSGSL